MDRSALRDLLDAEGIDPIAYDLEGRSTGEAYALERAGEGWAVFYSERGRRTGEARFDTEEAACAHLFELLVGDRAARRTRHEGVESCFPTLP
jgi:hypothetical protein